MKTKHGVLAGGAVLVLAVGIFFGVTFQARAQLQLKPAPLLDEKPLPEKPDTLVRIVAESQGLPVVPFEKLPRYGTYWQALNPFGSIMAPMPWLPDDAVQVYEIAPNQFLVDNGQAAAIPRPLRRSKLPPLTPDEFVAKQVKELVSLIDQVQTAQKDAELKAAVEQEFTSGNMMSAGMMRGMSLNGASQPAGMDYGTNLWLEIPAVTNNVAYVILHNVVQGEVYELMSSLALPAAPWNPEQALFTVTNQDWIPAWVPVSNRTNALFFWARDWTGIDANSNSLPDWWEWDNFGNFNQTANGDFDGDGANNLTEYQDGTDPNTITFFIRMTNNYVRTSSPLVPLNVFAGVPASKAVLVHSTNFTGATWTVFNFPNLTANLGANEGWHDVWIGLRGRPDTYQQTWHRTRIKLDLTPPKLVITSPSSTNASISMIQLQGYCPEALTAISYDLANGAGVITNQPAFVLGQAYDTNAWDFTTNYFQCFDIPLTNGANTITLYATDSAGNLTVTNFTFRLDYASMTNPPVVGLGWPQDGTRIGSDSFTWRGWLNDPTVQVLAQIVSTNGVTNSVIGRIGRNGDFWVENLPMAGGVNALTLSATDVFGNSFSTNITVVKSDVVLTVEAAALGQAAGGLISDTNYTIWVNGLQATNNGDGTWSAPHPHLTLNTTVVHVQALSPSASFGNGATANNYSSAPGPEAEVVLPWPDGVIYQKMTAHDYTDISIYGYSPYSWFPQFIVTNTTKTTDSLSWREESGGTGSYKYERTPTQQPNQNDLLTWVGGSYPEFGDGTRVSLPGTNQTLIAPPVTYGGSYFGSTDLTGAQGLIQLNRSQEAEFTLLTGDKPESTSGELYQISGGAQETIYTSQYIGVESMNKKPEAGRVAGCV